MKLTIYNIYLLYIYLILIYLLSIEKAFFFIFFFFFFNPSLTLNELSRKSHFAFFTLSHQYMCHKDSNIVKVSSKSSRRWRQDIEKEKRNTLVNTTPIPLFSSSHFSFLISFGFKRCSWSLSNSQSLPCFSSLLQISKIKSFNKLKLLR